MQFIKQTLGCSINNIIAKAFITLLFFLRAKFSTKAMSLALTIFVEQPSHFIYTFCIIKNVQPTAVRKVSLLFLDLQNWENG